MAVMDFREGGYVFARHKVQRQFSYDQQGWDDATGAPGASASAGLMGRVGRFTQYMGAFASVGLVIVMGVWGWQLVSRDVSGVPVIRAIEGAARTTPDDPGGQLTARTGMAVNNVAGGTAAAPTTEVAIAPAPVDLTDEDVAMGALGATAHEPAQMSETALNFDGAPIVPMSDAEARELAQAEADRAAADQAVAQAEIIDAPAADGAITDVVTDESGASQADAIAQGLAQAQAEANPGVLTASARPAPRPRTVRVAQAATVATDARPAAAAAATPAATPAPTPAPVAATTASGPVVQVGAFDSKAIAESQWGRLSGRNASLFSGKSPVIQQHQANGRTFWRLRVAGFGSLSEARQFCSALQSGGTDCLALNP
ncbi:SPOR domain-containing protein [Paracoccus sp. (in: a-proteobacteria)]|uniref:SPOR domain-containing protein n=1 Tax=Paracoccus sp. TaxID=267 RepID=UPI0026DF08EC|nr:SPOR domain-containing protein [Paracoccus sp. (in: a-proteobacteria)]MDO5646980.1 SPOR domain-containing protein [Paracoccus sp. (in: a-proteobacteria)]